MSKLINLSEYQRQVLDLAAQGLQDHDIAQTLNKNTPAIRFVLVSIYRQLGLNQRSQSINPRIAATLYYFRNKPQRMTEIYNARFPATLHSEDALGRGD